MIIEGLDQGSPEWLAMRVGMCTASRVADVMAKRKPTKDEIKSGKVPAELACRADYRWALAVERLTGLSEESYVSKPMTWGMDYEPQARAVYEATTGNRTTQVGFAMHDRIKWFGASPDSLVGPDGLLEIKCPNSSTHLGYLIEGIVPEEYKWQMLAEMACADRQWCDFVSFDPRLPKKFQEFIRRFHRDQEMIDNMEAEVEKFLAEVDLVMKRLEACNPLEDDLTGILTASLQQLEAGQ